MQVLYVPCRFKNLLVDIVSYIQEMNFDTTITTIRLIEPMLWLFKVKGYPTFQYLT
jgi:hypothetical protein